MEQSTNALAERLAAIAHNTLTLGLKFKEALDVDKAQRIVAELAKVRMTSPMLKFKRPAADESVKAVDKCREIAEEES